jgi:RNA polymerase sigma factor (sigma-70 family)
MKASQFNKIYDQYYLLVMKIAYSVLNDYHYAQDVCQEVFIILYQKMEQIDEELTKPWLLVNTKRKAIDFQRKKFYGREVCEESQELKKHSEITPEEKILQMEFESNLFRKLLEKDRTWFEIVIRVIISQESPNQVAQDMGISLSNLRTKMHRARAWIRDNFEEEYRGI